jgi:erythromycin esterase-like protein
MAADGLVNIGQLGRERHGRDAVVLVGFGSYRGTVVAAPRWGSPAEAMTVPPAREGSVERRLHELMPERAVLVFGGEDQPEWVTGTTDHRAIGVVYDPSFESWGNYVPTRLGERYDSFIWCDEATALHPLPALTTPGEMETYPAGV